MSHRLPAHPPLAPAEMASAAPASAPFARHTHDADAPSPSARVPWARYLDALARRKWIVLLVTLLGTGAGMAATRFMALQYRVTSTIWVELGSASGGEQGPFQTDPALRATALLELLRSRTVLDPVVERLQLHIGANSPQDRETLRGLKLAPDLRAGAYQLTVSADGATYALSAGAEGPVEKGRTDGPVGRAFGFRWTPGTRELRPGRVIAFVVTSPAVAAERLGQRIQPQMAENSNYLRLSMNGTDPRRTAEVLNAVAESYVTMAAHLKREKHERLTEILGEQLRAAEAGLRDAESALEDFRVRTVTLPSEQATPVAPGLQLTEEPVFANYFEMKVQRERLRQDRQSIERILASSADSALPLDALATVPSVRASAELMRALEQRTAKRVELRDLQQRYTEEYAPVRRLLEERDQLEREAIPQLAAELRAQLLGQEDEMERRIDSASQDLRQIPARAIEEARLERQVAIANDLHSRVKQRYEVARLSAAGSISDLRVLDPAEVPTSPLGDQRRMVVLAAMVGSLGIAVLGVLLLNQIDPRVRYPEHVSDELGLPVLGMVPHIRLKGGKATAEQSALAAEALREVRLNIRYAHGTAGPLMFTVSSAQAGDGKSFIAANLALSFAQQGHRTLLIDGDTRQGRQHHVLGTQREPGLIDFLDGRASLEEIVQETSLPSVHFVAAGAHLENAPELLASAAMAQLVRDLRSRYDAIVVDSPPLGAGIDPYVLSTATGNLLLVVRTGNTNRAFANAKLDLLERLPVRVLGAILNDVPAGQRAYRQYTYLPRYRAPAAPQQGDRPAGIVL